MEQFQKNKIIAGQTLKIYSDANVNDIPNETIKSSKNVKSNHRLTQ